MTPTKRSEKKGSGRLDVDLRSGKSIIKLMIKSFLDLDVYKDSFRLSIEIEDLVEEFPAKEKFLLSDQMRRASRAIPALIAEGYSKRESVKEFKKFLRDALAEANEMINHLSFAKARNYSEKPSYADELINRYHIVGKRLTKLHDNWQKFQSHFSRHYLASHFTYLISFR